jgi:peroxiredoxin
MALTPSNMLELGTSAPDFQLEDVRSEKVLSYGDIAGEKGTLVMFICNHCPYVVHVENEIGRIAKDYSQKGLGFVAISSNDIEKYPEDAPKFMRQQVDRAGFSFPYLIDSDQSVARRYDAACTPDFYLFDNTSQLVYRGRIDESRPGNDIPVNGKDLREALDNLINGHRQVEKQYPSMGCNIKWKA